ncbi:Uncharacterised protein [Mycobacteroides abscessus]|nr:Uncharacterised protein [Mycobacteroides abscessus]
MGELDVPTIDVPTFDVPDLPDLSDRQAPGSTGQQTP